MYYTFIGDFYSTKRSLQIAVSCSGMGWKYCNFEGIKIKSDENQIRYLLFSNNGNVCNN